MVGILNSQYRDLMTASCANKKLEEEAETSKYLKSLTKSLVNNFPKGPHKFEVTFQSDCGVYIGGKLNDNFIVVLELDLYYGAADNQMVDEG